MSLAPSKPPKELWVLSGGLSYAAYALPFCSMVSFLSRFAMSILESPLCYGEMKRGSFQLCVSISSMSCFPGNKGVWNALQLCLDGTK